MRTFGNVILLTTIAFLVAGMVESQPPPGGFGGRGRGGQGNDYFSLVNNAQVKGELKITQEQSAKIPAAGRKALEEILSEKQLKRLHEIYLRQKGNAAFLEADVKKELKITPEQVKRIQAALDAQAKEQAALFKGGSFPDFDKLREIQKAATDKVQATLTAAQKAAWTKMLGEPFELRRGFGGASGKGGKKKDLN
jgi:hypothetical protein